MQPFFSSSFDETRMIMIHESLACKINVAAWLLHARNRTSTATATPMQHAAPAFAG